MILVRQRHVWLILYITPFLMQEDESSSTVARTVMLPSRFFCPAIPVIFDEPSSIATINSFGIVVSIYLFFICCVVYCCLFLQIIWLSNSMLMYEYLFHPACE